MKTEDLLKMLNDIDEGYISDAGEDLENYLYNTGNTYYADNKRKFSWKRVSAAVACAAAVMVGVLFLVKNAGDIPIDENSSGTKLPDHGVTLSEPLSKPDPIIIEPKIRRLTRDGYDFSLEIPEGKSYSKFSDPFVKIDNEKEIALSFGCSGVSETQPVFISFYVINNGEMGECIADFKITSNEYQVHSIPYYRADLKLGDECVMQIQTKSDNAVVVKGRILP